MSSLKRALERSQAAWEASRARRDAIAEIEGKLKALGDVK